MNNLFLNTICTIWICIIASFQLAIACEESRNASLQSARKMWTETAGKDYSYVLQRNCFCPEEYRKPMRVVVENKKVISATYIEDSGKSVSSKVLTDLYTIEDWFAEIANAIERKAYQLHVDYHSEFGYPEKINIDMRERIVDDEQTVSISEVILNNQKPK